MKSDRRYSSVSSALCSWWPGLGVPRAEIEQKSCNLGTCDLNDTQYCVDLNSYLSEKKWTYFCQLFSFSKQKKEKKEINKWSEKRKDREWVGCVGGSGSKMWDCYKRQKEKEKEWKRNKRRLALVWRGIPYTETALGPLQQMAPQPSKCRRRDRVCSGEPGLPRLPQMAPESWQERFNRRTEGWFSLNKWEYLRCEKSRWNPEYSRGLTETDSVLLYYACVMKNLYTLRLQPYVLFRSYECVIQSRCNTVERCLKASACAYR